ncbi:PepSY domain protein [Leptospira yanagawae serovar Saopaulo str. Sao Paulo = ATCC 700523]|uniref:PepSY domain protein n=1 Tax=Leptospira yanagawae serovar Saopaulo str. Sao Paulo = ATCC 700523 TaxID=1249483 RepID=A0A5E8HAU5_9LEPT|nr:PepSY-associated TM helix domain-containing protein [Leptospira yanagawae]EOQ88581.1 PepSY domain protein [Leptospira yanagawae serovar Saopaulo str. Sao Paulo = ATCC 700523]
MKAKHWYKLHLVLGLFGSLFLLILGITGSLLVYGKEIQSFLTPMEIGGSEKRLGFDTLYHQFQKQVPDGSIAGWLVSDIVDQPDQIWYHHKENPNQEFVYLLDPFQGNVIGSLKDDRRDSFYGFLLVLHYSLFMGGIGYFITGCFAIIYLLLVFTGIKLYKRFWNSLFRLRFKESFQILFSDLHKFVGINAVWFHLILAITGGWWSIRDTLIRNHPEEKIVHGLWSESKSIESLLKKSKIQIPGFQLGYISFPHHSEDEPIGLYGNRFQSSAWESRYGSYVLFIPNTEDIVRKVDISKVSLLTQVLDAFRPLHFGTFANHFSKILWVMGGLTPAILSISGFLIFYKKRQNKIKSINTRTQSFSLGSNIR